MQRTIERILTGLALAAAIALAAPTPASAKISDLPPAVAAKIAAMGPKFDMDVLKATAALYKPLVRQPPYRGVTIVKNESYGPEARNRLDVYQPARHKSVPVLIFIPGGGFVGGSKDGYANLGGYFAQHGVLALVADYRLAPANSWPAGAVDVGKVVAWAKANAARYGGDPARLFLFGQSAGATHVADYTFNAKLHPAAGPGTAGTILVSGFYRPTAADKSPSTIAYYGADPAKYAERSPISHVGENPKRPLFLAYAEYDPAFLSAPTLALAEAICRRDGQCPAVHWLKGDNHVSTVFGFNSKDDELSHAVLDFVKTTR